MSDETPEEKPSPEELFERVITEGQFVPGDSGVFQDGRQIPWLDLSLAQSGQRFFQKHYTSIIFATSLYFGLAFGFKPITDVRFKTRRFHGIKQTERRILSTFWHLLTWYESDIVGCYAEGYKDIMRIRKAHDGVRQSTYKKLRVVDENEETAWDDPLLQALQQDMKLLDTSTFDRMNLTYDPPEPMS